MHTIRLSKGKGGLGFKVDKRNAIIGLTAGGAAERAGLRVGDVAWAVNGEALEAGKLFDVEQARGELRNDLTHHAAVDPPLLAARAEYHFLPVAAVGNECRFEHL